MHLRLPGHSLQSSRCLTKARFKISSADIWKHLFCEQWMKAYSYLRRRANARNVSFRNPSQCPIYIINSVDKTIFSGKKKRERERISFSLIIVIFTSIQCLPLLSGSGHSLLSSICIERSQKSGTFHINLRIIFQVIFNPHFSPKIKVSYIFERDSMH